MGPAVVFLVLPLLAAPALAAGSASSSAYGLAVDLQAGPARVQAGPEPSVAGSAPQA